LNIFETGAIMAGIESRKSVRRTSIFYLQTMDLDASAPLGRIVDINKTGLRLTGTQTIPEGLHFHVEIELPTTIRGRNWLELHIVSMWTKTAINTDLHESGFQIENLDGEAKQIIEVLDEEYVFAG
jgi:hypothetical protein